MTHQVEVGLHADVVEDLRRWRHDPQRQDLEWHDASEEEEDDGHEHGHHLTTGPEHRRAFRQNLFRNRFKQV